MVSGIISLVTVSRIVVFGLFFLLALGVWLWGRWQYIQGRIEGIKSEALAWCSDIDELRPPNWQSLPILSHKGREEQERFNKLYVEVYAIAIHDIGEKLAYLGIERMKKELEEAGMLNE